MDDIYECWGFGNKMPTPARPTALDLSTAFSAMLNANRDLAEAELNVPDYTGQWSTADYTAEAREAFNRATDAFEDAVVASVYARGPKSYPCGRMVEPPRTNSTRKE